MADEEDKPAATADDSDDDPNIIRNSAGDQIATSCPECHRVMDNKKPILCADCRKNKD